MQRYRNAKIVATLGPSSSTPEMIEKLFQAGVDVFRLNFSHGSHEDHQQRFNTIREIEQRHGKLIGILMDLQGPKLRLGTFAQGPVQLQTGAIFRLDLNEQPGDDTRAPLPHPEIFAALEPGTDLLLDDGKVRLEVQECGPDFAETRVATGGKLSDRKGVNVPGVVLPISALTEKDRRDLEFGLEMGVDWIALSFVQRPEDIEELKALVAGRAGVLAKLEKPAAIDRLEGIVDQADAIMVARGDLGVELPPEKVPSIQKRILLACRAAGKPVVVATQMLESMINAPVPTRAEASDVATAIYDGADAVMLSAETAAGKYPVEAVTIMDRIIVQVEQDPIQRKLIDAERPPSGSTTADAIAAAGRGVVRTLPIATITCYTNSGFTSLRAARERPIVPILSLTPHEETAHRLTLVWGVRSVQTIEIKHVTDMVNNACAIALREGLAKTGQPIVIAAGMPFGAGGTTNLLRIAWIEAEKHQGSTG